MTAQTKKPRVLAHSGLRMTNHIGLRKVNNEYYHKQ